MLDRHESNGKKVNLLSRNPLFKDIPKEKLAEIAQSAQDEIVPAHKIVFREGDPGDRFYMINSGKVRLFKTDREGVEIPVVELSAGEFFGQVAILTKEFRLMNVKTVEESHFTVFSKDQFERILQEYPSVSLAFAKQMSKWLVRDALVLNKKSERVLETSKLSWLEFFGIFFLSLLCGIIFNYSNPNGISLIPSFFVDEAIARLAPSPEIADQLQGGTIFVDARPSALYEKGHIEGAINIPLALFDIMYMLELSGLNKNKNIIVYGRTISSLYDEQVARKLVLRGHANTMILKGGLSAWKKRGYPIKS